jgi:hypothetical protein
MSEYPQEVIDTLRNLVKTQSEIIDIKQRHIERLIDTIQEAKAQIKILKGE